MKNKRNFRNLYLLPLALGLSHTSMAQIPDDQKGKSILTQNESYTLIGDERLNTMEARFSEINKDRQTIAGYRIQLFSSSGPKSFNQANEVQTEFLQIYAEVPAYVVHRKPAFKVRIGDFRTRLEAERFFIELKENFPDAFIVKDQINLPGLDIEKE